MISQRLYDIYQKSYISYPETTLAKIKRQFITDVKYEKFREQKEKYDKTSTSMLRLKNHFEKLEEDKNFKSSGLELTPKELFDISSSGSTYRFALLTMQLLEEGIIRKEIRVDGQSTNYTSYLDLPDTISEKNVEMKYIII